MREWSKRWMRRAVGQHPSEQKGSGPVVMSLEKSTPGDVPDLGLSDIEMWLEQKATEWNSDWRLVRLAGFSRGEDAAARQIAAATLKPTEELRLQPAPDDLYSTAAMCVRTLKGAPVGYLEPTVAEAVSRQVSDGDMVRCFVYKVTLNEERLPSSIVLALIS